MKGLVWFLAGVGAAAAIAQLAKWRYVRVAGQALDLNSAEHDQFRSLGLDAESAERIVENRPYRNKLDLLNRFVVSDAVYREIKDRIFVEERAAHSAYGVA